MWPLLVYEVPMTSVEAVERMVSRYLRQWLGVPRSFSSIGLYSKGNKFQLPFSSVVEEYKVGKARQYMMLRDSTDEKVRNAGVEVKTGRKWNVSKSVREAESRLQHSDIVGTVTSGKQGLGCVTRSSWKAADVRERRELVQRELRKGEEEDRHAKAVTMKNQGSWLNWEKAKDRKLSWNELWRMGEHKIRFLLRAVYDVLPSPTNLRTWGLTDDPTCKLCGRFANLEHVLSTCNKALTDGRYRWRHDRVLATIAAGLDEARRKERKGSKGPNFINFVRAGEKSKGMLDVGGILGTAKDWQMCADLKEQLKFPQEICITPLRPDIVLWSSTTKQVVMLELTVPWEERMEEAYERKRSKYQDLVIECQQNGWRTWCLPVEVGTRGFAGQSLWRAMSTLGVTGKQRKKIIAEAGREAEESSQWLWMRRDDQWGADQLLAGADHLSRRTSGGRRGQRRNDQ